MKRFIASLMILVSLLVAGGALATVSVETTRMDYTGNGTTGPFPYTFKIYDDDDLTVIKVPVGSTTADVTPLILNTDYTVSGVGLAAGGNVTLTSTISSAYRLVILRTMDYLQSQSWTSNQAITAASLNNGLDKLAMLVQRNWEKSRRSFQLRPGTASLDIFADEPEPSKVLGWNITGDAIVNYPLDDGTPDIDGFSFCSTEATCRAALAAGDIYVVVPIASFGLTANMTVTGKIWAPVINAVLSTNGFVFTKEASGTVLFNGAQIFDSAANEVEFEGYPTILVSGFGSGFDGTTEDDDAWDCAINAFPATGGVLEHDGVSLIASTLIWPNNGTTNYPIWLRGNVGSSQTGTFNTVTGGGGGQIKYTGAGTAIDFRNGDGSNLDFAGAITGIRLSGPYTTGDATPDNETNSLTVGLNFYNAKQAKIENVSIIGFGTGIYVANDLYYAKLRDLTISTAKWGMKTYGKWNGTTLENSKISTCNVGGLYAEYYGDNLSLTNCWIELCGRYAGNYSSPLTGYGLSAQFGQMVTVIGGSHYWESNGDSDGGDAHIRINGDGYYSTILNLYGQHFSYSSKRYIAYLKDATALNVHGCELLSYQGATAPAYAGYMFQFSGVPSDGTIRGNKLPKLDLDYDTVTKEIHIASQSVLSRLDIQDHLHPGITLDRAGDGANYTRVIPKGHVFLNDNPTKSGSGGLVGWQATEPGSGAFVDLNGVEPGDVQPDAAEDWSEGTITNGEFTMSVAAGDGAGAKEGLTVGMAIQIDTDGAVANGAFAAANFLDAAGVTTDWASIREVATTGEPSTVTLDRSLSSATVTGGLLRPNAVKGSYIGGRTWYKSKTSVSSSGTGEDNLMVADTLTAAMLKADSTIPILARGTITGTAGNHTLKIYLGTTAFTILSGTTTAGAWRFQGEIQVTAAAAQTLSGIFWNADGAAYIETAATEAISGALALKMTGECANGADTITQSLFVADLK